MRIKIKKLKTNRIMMYLTCQEREKKEKKTTTSDHPTTTHQTMWKRIRWRMQGEAERLDLAIR